MKTFTEEQVDKLVQTTLTETIEGFMEWIQKETDIVDKEKYEILNNAELKLKNNSKSILKDYIYPRLAKQGIKFSDK